MGGGRGGVGWESQVPLGDGVPSAGRGHHGMALVKLGHLGPGMSFLQRLGPLLIAELSPLCVSKIQGLPASSHLKGP